MVWWLTLVLFVGGLFLLLALRVPVAFAMFAMTAIAATHYYGFEAAGHNLVLSAFNSLASFPVVPITLFIVMGDIIFRSGVAERSLNAISDLFPRRVPGRTGVLTTFSGGLFGMMSGSTIANTALLGKTYLPTMLNRGYDAKLAMGTVMAGGGLAMIIPPSTLAIVWAATAGVPVGPILLAGIIPGILMMIGYMAITTLWAGRLKGAGDETGHESTVRTTTIVQRVFVGLREAVPLAVIVFLVLVLIFLGVATPSESAALGAVGALGLTIAYRKFSLSMLVESITEAGKMSAMIYLIMASSGAYSQVMSFSGATTGFVDMMTSATVHPALLMVFIQIAILILGMFLEQVSIMLITLPLLMPVVDSLGWSPIWFGIIMLINLRIGLVSPPFGMELFVMKGVAPPHITMGQVYGGAIPFVLSDLTVMTLLGLVPWFALVIPNLMV